MEKKKAKNKKSLDRSDMWLDLVTLYLSNNRIITVDEMEIILDEMSKKKIDLTRITLRDGSRISDEDASLILKTLIYKKV